MPCALSLNLLPPVQGSEYRWLNNDRADIRVGKVRGKVDGNILLIYSIIIFPEYKGNNYARKTIRGF